MVFVFVFGVVAAFVAPFLRRFGNAGSVCLAVGAAALVLFSVIGLTHLDLRQGLAAVDANRREYLFALACESPVLALGLFSLRWLRASNKTSLLEPASENSVQQRVNAFGS
jgi:hypothetical protein